jgi:hypothetical protein
MFSGGVGLVKAISHLWYYTLYKRCVCLQKKPNTPFHKSHFNQAVVQNNPKRNGLTLPAPTNCNFSR